MARISFYHNSQNSVGISQTNVLSLRELIAQIGDIEANRLLSGFTYPKNADIENFLKKKLLTPSGQQNSSGYSYNIRTSYFHPVSDLR